MKTYLDNVICSGIVSGDLNPPSEMKAARALISARDRGEINLLTSAESWREQDKTVDPQRRAILASGREVVPRVQKDHTVLGFAHSADRLGGFVAYPLVTDVVDEALLRGLKAVGLSDPDARHVMYAVHNGCSRFVTLDTKDILPKRFQVEAVCVGLKIVTPAELAEELDLL